LRIRDAERLKPRMGSGIILGQSRFEPKLHRRAKE
jgi:hypothetical protein